MDNFQNIKIPVSYFFKMVFKIELTETDLEIKKRAASQIISFTRPIKLKNLPFEKNHILVVIEHFNGFYYMGFNLRLGVIPIKHNTYELLNAYNVRTQPGLPHYPLSGIATISPDPNTSSEYQVLSLNSLTFSLPLDNNLYYVLLALFTDFVDQHSIDLLNAIAS
jgi:hypothetical protein